MKVKHEYERMPANEVWNVVVAYINKNKQFLSSTGIKYNAKVIIDSIEYKGGRKEVLEPLKESLSVRINLFPHLGKSVTWNVSIQKCQAIY